VTRKLLARLDPGTLRALVKLELRGEPPSTTYLRLNGKVEVVLALGAGEHPDIIVTTDALALDALLDGRLSLSDGLVSERVLVAGDVSKIVLLKRALSASQRA
jgi:hypothetical protein